MIFLCTFNILTTKRFLRYPLPYLATAVFSLWLSCFPSSLVDIFFLLSSLVFSILRFYFPPLSSPKLHQLHLYLCHHQSGIRVKTDYRNHLNIFHYPVVGKYKMIYDETISNSLFLVPCDSHVFVGLSVPEKSIYNLKIFPPSTFFYIFFHIIQNNLCVLCS